MKLIKVEDGTQLDSFGAMESFSAMSLAAQQPSDEYKHHVIATPVNGLPALYEIDLGKFRISKIKEARVSS